MLLLQWSEQHECPPPLGCGDIIKYETLRTFVVRGPHERQNGLEGPTFHASLKLVFSHDGILEEAGNRKDNVKLVEASIRLASPATRLQLVREIVTK